MMMAKEASTSCQRGVTDGAKLSAIDVTVAGRIDTLNREERHYQDHKRGNSWTYCHRAFAKEGKKEVDYLALQLAFYLASWGMYRGSSFLLELDYKIHIPAVEMMLEERYRDLFAIGNPFADADTAQNYQTLLFGEEGIYKRIEDYYLVAHNSIIEQRRNDDRKKLAEMAKKVRHDPPQESDTLITKILLGVYGCIPAYDRYFKDGIGFFGKQKALNAKGKALCGSSKALATLLNTGPLKRELEAYWQANKHNYTFMKVVDMYFFSLGTLLEDGVEKENVEDSLRRHFAIG